MSDRVTSGLIIIYTALFAITLASPDIIHHVAANHIGVPLHPLLIVSMPCYTGIILLLCLFQSQDSLAFVFFGSFYLVLLGATMVLGLEITGFWCAVFALAVWLSRESPPQMAAQPVSEEEWEDGAPWKTERGIGNGSGHQNGSSNMNQPKPSSSTSAIDYDSIRTNLELHDACDKHRAEYLAVIEAVAPSPHSSPTRTLSPWPPSPNTPKRLPKQAAHARELSRVEATSQGPAIPLSIPGPSTRASSDSLVTSPGRTQNQDQKRTFTQTSLSRRATPIFIGPGMTGEGYKQKPRKAPTLLSLFDPPESKTGLSSASASFVSEATTEKDDEEERAKGPIFSFGRGNSKETGNGFLPLNTTPQSARSAVVGQNGGVPW